MKTLLLGGYSVAHNLELSDTIIKTREEPVLLRDCKLTRCDVSALTWDQIRTCTLIECELPDPIDNLNGRSEGVWKDNYIYRL